MPATHVETRLSDDQFTGNETTLSASKKWSGADLVAYWEREGLIGPRPEITDSLEHARAIRRKAERRGAGGIS